MLDEDFFFLKRAAEHSSLPRLVNNFSINLERGDKGEILGQRGGTNGHSEVNKRKYGHWISLEKMCSDENLLNLNHGQ